MPEQLWITALLNKYLAGVANGILVIFHLHSPHPEAPIPNYVAMQFVVFVFLLLVFADGAFAALGGEPRLLATRFREHQQHDQPAEP